MKIFKNIDFLLLVIARLIINFADSLFYIVSIWYTSKTLASPYYTSIAIFLFLLPETLLIFAGPIIDRSNPKRILIFSLATQLVLLGILAIFFHQLEVVFLLTIVLISAFMSAITYPIEDTMIPQIVDSGELVAANSVLSITYKIFDATFNGVSGFLLAAFSTVALYRMNLIVFALPILVVFFIRFNYSNSDDIGSFGEYLSELKEGVSFIKKGTIFFILAPLIFVNFFNSSNAVIMPFFCQQYRNPSETFGLILSMSGIGGTIGALLINYVKKFLPVGKLLSMLLIINGFLWLCFVFTGGSILSYAFVLLAYVFYGMYNIVYYSLFQAITPVEMLGRVTTGINTVITLAMPLGSFFGGWILNLLPYHYSMMFSGISVIITGILYYRLNEVKSLPFIDNITRMEA